MDARLIVYSGISGTLRGTQSWAPDNTFFITPLETQIEYTEDNLRFIKLHLPIKDGYSWKGNQYLPEEPYISLYDFQNDNNMQDWDYFYNGDPAPSETIEDQTYNNVLSVEYDEIPDGNLTDTIPMTDTFPATRSYSIEKYSKGIALCTGNMFFGIISRILRCKVQGLRRCIRTTLSPMALF
ncbi:MAG: hypothetical protein WDO19_06575 [Bacteroidota bacterium]